MAAIPIIVIEDDRTTANFLVKSLKAEGYYSKAAYDATTGLDLVMGEESRLVILDLMLPDNRGYQVLQTIKHHKPRLPVIILSALNGVEDRVAGLELGANDYMSKPFAVTELLARVRVQLRKQDGKDYHCQALGVLTLDLKKRVLRNQRTLAEKELTAYEFSVLELLLRNPGRVISKEQLLSEVWNFQFEPDGNIVEVYISYLRKKIRALFGKDYIQTVRRIGYRVINPEV